MEAFAGDPEAFASADAEFHQLLANITHNPLLVFLLDTLRDLMVQVRSSVASLPNLAERVMPTHLEIVECVRRRDREGARAAMARHLEISIGIQRELRRKDRRKARGAASRAAGS